MRNAYKIFGGTHVGKRPLKRPRHRWEDNTKTDNGTECGLAQDSVQEWSLLNMVINLWLPEEAGNFLNS